MSNKPHYPILDALRGVAALLVVAFHILEAHSTSHLDQVINHGYLAVDFFFLLSGFVIGYAYDDRWGSMTVGNFIQRRLERLQPMVIIGMIIGAALFYLQASTIWPMIATVPVWKVLMVMLIGFTMIPLPPSMDIRGWNETYPLNGPAWSLFYEYIVNLMYALFVRKFSNTALSVLVTLAAINLIYFSVTTPSGDIIGGWSLEPEQLRIGFTRVMYPFFAGLLLFRATKLTRINNAFLWCSLLIVAILSMPRLGGEEHLWMNGLYEALSIVFLFPLIVYLGASGELNSEASRRLCKFLGDISYPIYITHFPLIYIYTAWVRDNKISIEEGLPWGILTFVAAIVLSWVALKFYDEPIRARLQKRRMAKELGRKPDAA